MLVHQSVRFMFILFVSIPTMRAATKTMVYRWLPIYLVSGMLWPMKYAFNINQPRCFLFFFMQLWSEISVYNFIELQGKVGPQL